MTRPRAVIFDYGHTLVNFAPAEDSLLACYEEVRALLTDIAEIEIPEALTLVERVTRRIAREVQDSYAKRELEELDIVRMFQAALGDLGFVIDRELGRAIAEKEHRAMLSALQAKPENLAALDELRSLGLRLGLASNAHFLPSLMHDDLARLGIGPLIDAAVFSAEIGVRKPHPEIFRSVLRRLDVLPEEAVFVGDRLRDDIGGARALGMRSVLTHEFRQEPLDGQDIEPDGVIETLPDLLPLIRTLLY